MKRLMVLTTLFTVVTLLSGCGIFDFAKPVYTTYCEDNPDDQGCISGGIPTGETEDEDTFEAYFDFGTSSDSFYRSTDTDGTLIKPDNPVKVGYTFIGWYTDTAFTTLFDFNTILQEDITLYPKFQLIEVFHVTDNITIYKSDNDRLTANFLDFITRYYTYDDILDEISSTSSEDIETIFQTTGNGITYNYYSKIGTASNVVSINDVYASPETILGYDYAYVFRMEAINRDRWWIADINGDVLWEIPEPNVGYFADGFYDYLSTSEASDIIQLYGGIMYDNNHSWNPEYTHYDYYCSDNFNEEEPVFKIGVAPGIETIARALVEGYHDVCPNFIPDIQILETNDIYRRVQGDQSNGDTSTYLHFGFSDREFDSYDTEPVLGLTTTTVNLDAIVFQVNTDNTITNLTVTDIFNIFNGTSQKWDELETTN